MKYRIVNAFLLAITIAAATAAYGEDRVALVIGNSKYEGAAALRNPANDADAIEATLKKLDFKVTKKVDLERKDLEKAVVEFHKSLKKGSVALFFYAGHGVQVKGENYLVPIKAGLEAEFEVREKCYKIDQVIAAMDESQSGLKIVILDCCRDNPFTRGWTRGAANQGMASIADVPDGTIIAFATAPGKTAADGKGGNSPYTTHLIASLNSRPKGGLEITEALRDASRAVKKETGQVPWLNLEASLDKFYLWRDTNATSTAATTSPPAADSKPTEDLGEWGHYRDSGVVSKSNFERFRALAAEEFYMAPNRHIPFKVEDRRAHTSAVRNVRVGKTDEGLLVETELDATKKTRETVVFKPDGIYRTTLDSKKIEPPIKILAITDGKIAKQGTEWTVDSKIGDSKYTGTFRIDGFLFHPGSTFSEVIVSGKYKFEGESFTLFEYYGNYKRGLVERSFSNVGKSQRWVYRGPVKSGEPPK